MKEEPIMSSYKNVLSLTALISYEKHCYSCITLSNFCKNKNTKILD